MGYAHLPTTAPALPHHRAPAVPFAIQGGPALIARPLFVWLAVSMGLAPFRIHASAILDGMEPIVTNVPMAGAPQSLSATHPRARLGVLMEIATTQMNATAIQGSAAPPVQSQPLPKALAHAIMPIFPRPVPLPMVNYAKTVLLDIPVSLLRPVLTSLVLIATFVVNCVVMVGLDLIV